MPSCKFDGGLMGLETWAAFSPTHRRKIAQTVSTCLF
jgi:hypothetical protein